jgi:RNA-binding protein YhbY
MPGATVAGNRERTTNRGRKILISPALVRVEVVDPWNHGLFISALKAQAQRLKATLKVAKEGLNLQFLAALDDALKNHELVKVKFDGFKEQKKELALQPAERGRIHQVRQKVASCSQDFATCERSQGFFLDWAFPNSRHTSFYNSFASWHGNCNKGTQPAADPPFMQDWN